MSEVILGELQVVGTAFFCGALITIVYDVLRIFRRVISHGNVWIGIEDLLFWIWTSFWIFGVLYRENDGNLRLYTMISMALGMILYHKTISEPLVDVLGTVFRKVVGLLLLPIRFLKKYIRFFGKKLKNRWRSIIMNKSK